MAKKKEELDKTRDVPKEKMYHNSVSDQYVQQKFERELQQAEQEIHEEKMQQEHHEEGKEPTNKVEKEALNYQRMSRALQLVGFLPQEKAPEAADQTLC